MFGKKFMKNIDRIRKTRKIEDNYFRMSEDTKSRIQYGPHADYILAEPLIEHLSTEELETKKSLFLSSFNDVNFEQIEIDTRDQSNNEKWFYERKIRLTASRFGQICKMRANTSCKNTVYNILYAPSAQSVIEIRQRSRRYRTLKSRTNY